MPLAAPAQPAQSVLDGDKHGAILQQAGDLKALYKP
jgi:hypothetical protein